VHYFNKTRQIASPCYLCTSYPPLQNFIKIVDIIYSFQWTLLVTIVNYSGNLQAGMIDK